MEAGDFSMDVPLEITINGSFRRTLERGPARAGQLRSYLAPGVRIYVDGGLNTILARESSVPAFHMGVCPRFHANYPRPLHFPREFSGGHMGMWTPSSAGWNRHFHPLLFEDLFHLPGHNRSAPLKDVTSCSCNRL